MAFLLSIGLGLTVIIVGQLKIMRAVGDSVIAFHAADTGIEQALYQRRKQGIAGNITITYINPSTRYWANYNEDAVTGKTWWEAVGDYKGTKRAIEITSPLSFDFSISLFSPETGCPGYDCFYYVAAEDTYYAEWYTWSPEVITVITQLISGQDRPITFSVTSSDPRVGVKFNNGPTCDPTASCDSVNDCSSPLCFTFISTTESYQSIVIIKGDAYTLSKTVTLKVKHSRVE